MYYYKVSLLGSPLEPLTYSSEDNISEGSYVSIPLQKRVLKGVVITSTQQPEFQTQTILEKLPFFVDHHQLKLAKFIAQYYICSLGDALVLFVPFSTEYNEKNDVEYFLNVHFKLSSKQENALDFLKDHNVSLLFGDTGSGKTEIYMKYFESVVQQNKQCLFLMPEISLTPQIGKRLEKYFGENVVLWHSKLTPKQKQKRLEEIYTSKAKIIAGPRSALFLPFYKLGLIVVDEEHDDSYKSSSRPRYNARDMAIYKAKLLNIPVVLGSATPSLSSYIKFPHIRLKGAHLEGKKTYIYEQNIESLTPKIYELLDEMYQRKEQAIVFLPTRANFKYLICADCGHRYECIYCSIGMSIHQKSRALKCHYCNYMQPIPQECPKCFSHNLVSARIGTAQALEEIQEKLPFLNVAQFDRDVITTTRKLKQALDRFNKGEIDVLIGTQMLSKGHDYHNVTLAIILGLDNMLNMGDYRAREKALAAFIQVSGRCGRAKDGVVFAQTFNEMFFNTYVNAYELFLEEEKEFRKELYPPYKKLCRILFAHKNGLKAQESMKKMEEGLRAFPNVEIVGYGKCIIEKVANKYRFEILLRASKSVDLIYAIGATKNTLSEIDMDPIDFG